MSFQTAKGYVQLFLVIIVLILTYSLTYFFELKKTTPQLNQSEKSLSKKLETISVKSQLLTLKYSETAQVQPQAFIPIIPEVTGRIENISNYFVTGKCFKKNAVLFSIATDEVRAEYESAKASLEQSKANLAVVQAEANLAISEWKILNEDNQQPIPSLVAKLPQLEQAKASVEASQARVRLTQIRYQESQFSFPFDGCVSNVSLEKGQFVSRGQSIGNVYAQNKLEVTAQMTQATLDFIQKENFNIYYIGNDNKKTFLKINRISPIIDNKTQFFTIVFSPDTIQNLTPQQIGRVVFLGQSPQKVFKIKSQQIFSDNTVKIVDKHTQAISSMPIEIIDKREDDIYISAFSDEALIVKDVSLALSK